MGYFMEEKDRCQKRVYDHTGFHSVRCSRKAVKDGFCKQHHPDTVKARQERSDKAWREKFNNSPEMKLKRALEENEKLRAELETAKGGILMKDTALEALQKEIDHFRSIIMRLESRVGG